MVATAVDTSLPALLSSLTASLASAAETVPEQDAVIPPKDGISLLDVKNELLLSYLQNLVFLILLKLRENTSQSKRSADGNNAPSSLSAAVVKKLVELRLYLEKGVRPLEGRLKYQIDKVIRAAEDADRSTSQQRAPKGASGSRRKASKRDNSDESGSGSDEEDDSDAESDVSSVNELAYRPNPAAFVRAAADEDVQAGKNKESDGIYRPPRINPTAMPTTSSGRDFDRADAGEKMAKSTTLDEFVATELSTAPLAQPSIGSTIVAGGRHMKSAAERAEEADRRRYEEENFVRLPKLSKKEQAKHNKKYRAGYGGEDWRELGIGSDRIDRLTKGKGGKGALERSRKRPIEDGPRGGDGLEMGKRFEKRRKTVDRYRKK